MTAAGLLDKLLDVRRVTLHGIEGIKSAEAPDAYKIIEEWV
jgi:hypothetical protein